MLTVFGDGEWKYPTCHDLLIEAASSRDEEYIGQMDGVDVLSIACKADAIAVKGATPEMFTGYGRYSGSKDIFTGQLLIIANFSKYFCIYFAII